ncbi:WGR domain-containing protein [Tardiphaga robiniae]|uniref:WGR domain-containing protein n=1 Tax=Tardiphaga robiniae TaxID=943830 RepID=A0A7G6U858_9BRAD|nr:WGR domain-containing protein [Tardiphaga robiniae]
MLLQRRSEIGEWAVIREWGRIGRGGTTRGTPYATVQEAEAARDRQCHLKQRRGYAAPAPHCG